MATANGKPTAKATAIVDANAESKLTSGCALSSSDMAPLHGSERQGAVTGTAETATRRTLVPNEGCSDMVNAGLMAQG